MIWVKFSFPEVSRNIAEVVSKALILQPGFENLVPFVNTGISAAEKSHFCCGQPASFPCDFCLANAPNQPLSWLQHPIINEKLNDEQYK